MSTYSHSVVLLMSGAMSRASTDLKCVHPHGAGLPSLTDAEGENDIHLFQFDSEFDSNRLDKSAYLCRQMRCFLAETTLSLALCFVIPCTSDVHDVDRKCSIMPGPDAGQAFVILHCRC